MEQPLDALDGLLSPPLITAAQQHMGTLAGELQGSLKTNSRVGACDQGNAAGLLSLGIGGPRCHRSAANPLSWRPLQALTSFYRGAEAARPPWEPISRRSGVILAGLIGNVMEWYDFALYGYFVGIFSDQFFPSSDPNASLIAAFGAFAAGFGAPFGGMVLGRIGDRVGRRQPSGDGGASHGLDGILPTYQRVLGPDRVGVAHPARTSAGGEYTTSCFWLGMPANRRSLVVWGLWGSVLGMLGSALEHASAA